MKYLFLAYLDEKAWGALTPEEQQAEMATCNPHIEKIVSAKKMIDGAPLRPTTEAVVVKLRGGKRVVTDGPYAELREQLGGYTLVDAESMEEAIDIASGFFEAAGGDSRSTVEIREVIEFKMPEPQ